MGMSWQVAFQMKGHMVNYLFAAVSLWNTKDVTSYAYSFPFPLCSFLFILRIQKIKCNFKRHR